MSKLSAIIRAFGFVRSRNLFSNPLALDLLLKSPKLLPSMSIVSNLPKDGRISSIDMTRAFFSPLALQTRIANGEMSIPVTAKPFCCRNSECLPAPQPMSSTLPFANLRADFSRDGQSLNCDRYAPPAPELMKPSSLSTISTPSACTLK